MNDAFVILRLEKKIAIQQLSKIREILTGNTKNNPFSFNCSPGNPNRGPLHTYIHVTNEKYDAYYDALRC